MQVDEIKYTEFGFVFQASQQTSLMISSQPAKNTSLAGAQIPISPTIPPRLSGFFIAKSILNTKKSSLIGAFLDYQEWFDDGPLTNAKKKSLSSV